jgi:Caspase domain/Domain of unknown function (DUF4384)
MKKLFFASVLSLLAASSAQAENHALIMWIGQYQQAANNLPGIDLDAANAKKIAKAMGVASDKILEFSNSQLTRDGMRSAIGQLTAKIKDGDKVFIYYSGHGYQTDGEGGKCTEALVPYDADMYYGRELQENLEALSRKASQIVMLNDSCFSGGVGVSKAMGASVAKAFKGQVKASAAGGYQCGVAVNKMARNLTAVGTKNGAQVLYLAASSDQEVAGASSLGSYATLGWARCLTQRSADSSGDGLVSGEELLQCSRRYISEVGANQTITMVGNGSLPVLFNLADASTATRVNASATLESIRAAADPNQQLTLNISKKRLSISSKDKLAFSVTAPQAGYLYLLHVGSDGATFDSIFPNDQDSNNYISAGTHSFPRAGWALQAMGPTGTGYVMAYLSSTPKSFGSNMSKTGPFATVAATSSAAKNLVSVATGADVPGSGRFGTSAVVAFEEIQ